MLTESKVRQFQEAIWEYYLQHRRDLPWRHTDDPYKILVSEIMLQQTQVNRVIPKYQAFLTQFSTIQTLAEASLAEVLAAWSGLGYNCRAKFLWESAKIIATEHQGRVPPNLDELVTLPGIGRNTAAAVLVYAFNQPLTFVETNIRTVYIHHFFPEAERVSDKEILVLVQQTIDQDNPRDFYWALIDYGTYLKQQHGNLSRLSKHYTKQSSFHGSKRQLRGEIIRRLLERSYPEYELVHAVPDGRLSDVIDDLVREGMVTRKNHIISLLES